MELVWIFVMTFLIGLGSGTFLGYKLGPKEVKNIQNSKTEVKMENMQKQSTDIINANITVIFEKGFTNLVSSIIINNITNIILETKSNSNSFLSITNLN